MKKIMFFEMFKTFSPDSVFFGIFCRPLLGFSNNHEATKHKLFQFEINGLRVSWLLKKIGIGFAQLYGITNHSPETYKGCGEYSF